MVHVMTKAKWDEATQRCSAGESIRSVARCLGVNHNTLWKALRLDRPLYDPLDGTLETLLQRTRLDDATGCLEWQGSRTREGYGRTQKGCRDYGAHRLALELSTGVSLGDLQTRHMCHNPPCCNPDHLQAGTPKENADDTTEAGRRLSKLSREEVVDMVLKIKAGELTYEGAAQEFGIGTTQVWRIVTGRSRQRDTHHILSDGGAV